MECNVQDCLTHSILAVLTSISQSCHHRNLNRMGNLMMCLESLFSSAVTDELSWSKTARSDSAASVFELIATGLNNTGANNICSCVQYKPRFYQIPYHAMQMYTFHSTEQFLDILYALQLLLLVTHHTQRARTKSHQHKYQRKSQGDTHINFFLS
jgi:hypothetical protein